MADDAGAFEGGRTEEGLGESLSVAKDRKCKIEKEGKWAVSTKYMLL